MKRIRIEITQELEVPDDCTVLHTGPCPRIFLEGKWIVPQVEYMQIDSQSDTEVRLMELDVDVMDSLMQCLAKDNVIIVEKE